MKQCKFAEENYEYNGLHGLAMETDNANFIITKWKPTAKERLKMLFTPFVWVVLSSGDNIPMEIRLDKPFEGEKE